MGLFGNTLQRRMDAIDSAADRAKSIAAAFNATTDDYISSVAVLQMQELLVGQKATLAGYLDDAELQDYAREQTGDSTLSLNDTINALLVVINGVIASIVAVYPKDATGYLLEKTVAADGSITVRAFNRTDLATVFTATATLESAI